MSEPSTNGANPRRGPSVVQRVAYFSTTVAFVVVALIMEERVFYAAAAFGAVAAVAELYRGRYPRAARVGRWVGRAGMVLCVLLVLALMTRR